MTNNIKLLYVVSLLVTNWLDFGTSYSTLMMPPEANTTTYIEYGTIYSNRMAVILIEGVTNTLQLSSQEIGKLERTYTISKPQKVYGETKIQKLYNDFPIGSPFNITNYCISNCVTTNYFKYDK